MWHAAPGWKASEDFFGISNVHGSFTDISDPGSPMGDVAPLASLLLYHWESQKSSKNVSFFQAFLGADSHKRRYPTYLPCISTFACDISPNEGLGTIATGKCSRSGFSACWGVRNQITICIWDFSNANIARRCFMLIHDYIITWRKDNASKNL